ncbi:cytidylyltransferase domain-containing protein [Endozoicomonas ascidiicola]|uniref:acylneuraminate cytidylyltransferase family protein n=1 Tax=Endozoicomonas ascidiicola TaxID=1698521 RepID=UPI000836A980|nr:acylneuraminate cytidylyltransferase family protein [Endozoicomonas ascidiicola]
MKTKQRCIAFIFARGGSKGVPRKNIKPLNGLPLIGYSIDIARQCPSIDRVIVSTDDEEIAEVARSFGAEVPFMRPEALSGDKSSEFDAWKHAITAYKSHSRCEFDVFVSLPATSPLRSVEDVETCINLYKTDNPDVVVTVKESARSPFFNMVNKNKYGFCEIVNKAADGTRYTRRQDVPEVYDMTTVAYVSSPEFILKSLSIFDGQMKSVLIPDERAIDIDTMLDFKFAEFLMSQRP